MLSRTLIDSKNHQMNCWYLQIFIEYFLIYFQLTEFDEFRDRLLLPEGRVAALVEEDHEDVQQSFGRKTFGFVGIDGSLEKKWLQISESFDPAFDAGPRGLVGNPVGGRTVHFCFTKNFVRLFFSVIFSSIYYKKCTKNIKDTATPFFTLFSLFGVKLKRSFIWR